MLIEVRTGNHLHGGAGLDEMVDGEVRSALGRFAEHITRVEVHFSDHNGPKSGNDDKRCVLEVRLAGRQPVVTSHDAESLDDCMTGAAEKMKHLLDSTFGKIGGHKGHTPSGGVGPE